MSALRQYRTLAKVKSLREQKALEALQKARRAELEGEQKVERLTRELAESAATLPDRIDALYRAVIGKTIDLQEIDLVKHRAKQLEADHQKIGDRKARAEHALIALRKQTQEASEAYREAQMDREKYDGLLDDLKREILVAATTKEEAEVEDLFARPRNRIAGEESRDGRH
jgi:hypothetical protein